MRLTNTIRQKICDRAIASAFDERFEEMKEKEAALFRKVYEHVIPKTERDLLSQFNSCWFEKSSTINLNVSGSYVRLSTGNNYYNMPYWTYNGTANDRFRFATIPAGPLADEIMAHCQKKECLKVQQNDARLQTRTLLDSVSNMKALKLLWPEGESFWEDLAKEPAKANLPAVQVDSVNKALGLPKAVDQAA